MNEDVLIAYRYALAQLLDGSRGPQEIVYMTGLSEEEAKLVWEVGQHALRQYKTEDEKTARLVCPSR